ncbi:MAG: AAA family ATPase [Epsilonproteobacteria bacterium]|nr:AAA family ATPase [Campylobacterota bacterium]
MKKMTLTILIFFSPCLASEGTIQTLLRGYTDMVTRKIEQKKEYQKKIEDLEKKGNADKELDQAREELQIISNWLVHCDETVMQNGTKYLENQIGISEKKIEGDIRIKEAVATQREKSRESLEFYKLLLKPKSLGKISLFASLLGGSLISAYFASKFLHTYLETQIGRPKLIRDSSIYQHTIWSMLKKTFGVEVEQVRDAIFSFDNLILPQQLTHQLRHFAQITKNKHLLGLPYQHIMLHGKPGTGKTMFARILSYFSGMDYAIMSGADFAQFKNGEDIAELHNLFDWAEQSKNGLIIFIDEADAVFRNRKFLDKQGINLIDAFLSRTNASSKHFMLVFATNYPEDIDYAVSSRINKKINIPLPGHDELVRMLELYIQKYLRDDIRVVATEGQEVEFALTIDAGIDHEFIVQTAKLIEGFSGREVDQFIDEIRSNAYGTDDLTVTKELFIEALYDKLSQHNESMAWQEKTTHIQLPNILPLAPSAA